MTSITSNDKVSENATTFKWSILGKVVMLLFPILLYCAAAAYTQEIKAEWLSQDSPANVEFLALLIGVFFIRMAAIILLVIAVIKLLGSPFSTTPRWMKKEVNSVNLEA